MSTISKNEPILVDDQSLFFRQIIDSSPALLHTARPDGYLDFFNQTWLNFAGEPLEKLLGWGWTSCIHPQDVEALVQRMRESFARGKPFQETSRVRRADGVYRWMLHQKVPVLDSDGNIIKWYGSSIDIDDRKRAEEQLTKSSQELQRSEFYLAEAQRLGQIGNWVIDPAAGRFSYWSRGLFVIYGLDPERDAPSLDEFLACVHSLDREFIASLLRRMRWEGVGCDTVKRIVRPDGEVRHIRCVGVPVFENGKLARIVGSAMDVTEQEFLTRELRRREAYLMGAQRLSRAGSCWWKVSTGAHVWSEGTYRIFEYDPDQPVTFERIIERVHPEDRSLAQDAMQRTSSSGGIVDCRYRLCFPDGRTKHVQVVASPLGLPDDESLEFAGAVLDITERKEAEEKLRRSEEELRTIVETIPVFVGTALPDGSVDFVSESWLKYTGLSKEQWLGWAWVSVLHPDDLDRGVAKWRAALAEGVSVEQELRYRRSDGSYHWFLDSNFPLRDDKGQVAKWYRVRSDIDGRKQAEDRLRDTRAKLAKASRLATVAELAGSIAHELNQPLMSILANAQAAKRWLTSVPSTVAEAKSSIERVIRDARAADETMQHIRALFKQESIDKKDVNIPDILHEVVRVVQEDPKKRDVPIESRFEQCLPVVHVDQIQIQQVFINLIVNAIEALEGQQAVPQVVLQATSDSNGMLIQVIDNGPGVDDPDRIFDAFMTTKEKGMGMGLAVSRSIVEAHGGRLWAENNKTGGATFNVTLPLTHVSCLTLQAREYA